MTRVVNVRDFEADTSKPKPFIYVGRPMRGVYDGHPLANPFKLKRNATEADREACLKLYSMWLRNQPGVELHVHQMARLVKRFSLPLACWCAPKRCHADLLAAMVDRLLEAPQ